MAHPECFPHFAKIQNLAIHPTPEVMKLIDWKKEKRKKDIYNSILGVHILAYLLSAIVLNWQNKDKEHTL